MMKTWIALLRGINVGGHNILPMAELERDLESLDLRNVRTVIQSGNVVFDAGAGTSSSLRERIADCIEDRHGFRPQILLLDRRGLLDAVEANPFPDAVSDPKSLHFFFLAEPPSDPDMGGLDALRASTERYELTGGVFYLHAPDGLARSKLAARVERSLGVAATARNYRTVDRVLSILVEEGG